MERKRKLPARAAARVEQAALKRQAASPEPCHSSPGRSPPLPPVRDASPPPPPPPPLPTSINVRRPLPTVEDAQPANLSAKEYQSIAESGALAESLSRSRQKWVSEGLFEKYWTKPYKRKGIVHEEPNNPSKDTMIRAGMVTLTIEPHVIEATMFAVKAPKPSPLPVGQLQTQPARQPPAQAQPSSKLSPSTRPVLQYGPPNGTMPPPPILTPALTKATLEPVASTPAVVAPPAPAATSLHQTSSPISRLPNNAVDPTRSLESASSGPTASNTAPASAQPSLAPVSYAVQPAVTPLAAATPARTAGRTPPGNPVPGKAVAPLPASSRLAAPTVAPPSSATQAAPAVAQKSPQPGGTAPAAKSAANDPVIALLAQKASGDPELRDLMKRVAVGQANDGELVRFHKIIEQLQVECKQKATQRGPSADKLLVDNRTVKYFADEVRTILDIVLASNPRQTSAELRPPPQSDHLVVLLVKTALEDQRTRDMIHRIANGQPGLTDAQDLKEILDRLHRDAKTVPRGPPPAVPPQVGQTVPNGRHNGHGRPVTSHPPQKANAQAHRSAGPLPVAARPDISAVVFDFGNGDRYLFPKYSILEFLPSSSGQQVIASFLMVRKGSTSEYGSDPNLDYYQPVTMRLSTNSGRHLDVLARVVAPQDEVRRYMDHVMDNMTRAEYVLLAMRLPRADHEVDQSTVSVVDEVATDRSTLKSDTEPDKNGVLWSTTSTAVRLRHSPDTLRFQDSEQQSQLRYERLIRSVAEKDLDTVW